MDVLRRLPGARAKDQVARLIVAALLSLTATAAYAETWQYSVETDQLTSKEQKFATLKSSNTLALRFPYQGQNFGHFQVRTGAQRAVEVSFWIDKGQMLCRSYEWSCEISVRFDDRPPMKFIGIGPSDHSTNYAFLRDAARFVTEARKAKRVLVGVELYQSGQQLLEFGPLTPLTWPPK